ncbi:MAG TPA: hypothetical protein VMU53_18280 [Candidatus Sulfotelmatobacter sp.]|nr:hypothetical protein [Candidatus Sulfotelmatobacter sp.]
MATKGSISLLHPVPEKSHKSQVLAFTIVGLAIALAIVLYFTFRYYPEKKAASEFFSALVAGDTDRAYQLWKPGPSYRKDDFLADWGPAGYYGPVKSYKIMGAKAPDKSNAIAVDIAVSPFTPLPSASDAVKSEKTKVVTIWVSPGDKSLTFPP